MPEKNASSPESVPLAAAAPESAPITPRPGFRPAPPPEMERLGSILRRVREQRGEELGDISDYLRIRPSYLFALENSRYEELPADAYVIGFLRSYANYLGLDGRGAIDQYRREMSGRRKKPLLSMPQPLSEGRAPTVAILIVALVAVLLIYALWYGLASSDRASVTAATPLPQPESSLTSSAGTDPLASSAPLSAAPEAAATPPATAASSVENASSTPAAASTTETSAPAETKTPETTPTETKQKTDPPKPAEAKGQTYGEKTAQSRVVVRCEKESWVLIADKQGNTVFDKILKPGDVYNVPVSKGLTLTTGNGGGLVLSLDGTELPKIADESRVARAVSLDPDALKTRFKAKEN
ncbi:MAG: helix-turn-helix domain-containing protein [Alphaproteobacteria bacterium]|nr:helix-turn-helix domain-containing protein [Alphaproteobacteria bacterium]